MSRFPACTELSVECPAFLRARWGLSNEGTAAQHEFQELPFIMNVMIFRSAGTAAIMNFSNGFSS